MRTVDSERQTAFYAGVRERNTKDNGATAQGIADEFATAAIVLHKAFGVSFEELLTLLYRTFERAEETRAK